MEILVVSKDIICILIDFGEDVVLVIVWRCRGLGICYRTINLWGLSCGRSVNRVN